MSKLQSQKTSKVQCKQTPKLKSKQTPKVQSQKTLTSQILPECDVCFHPIVKSVECQQCNYISCSNCYENYSLSFLKEKKESIKCMKCSKHFSYTFILKNFDKKFLKTYDNLRSDILFDMEKSYFPEYIGKIEKKEKDSEYTKLNKKIRNNLDMMHNLADEIEKQCGIRRYQYIYSERKKKILEETSTEYIKYKACDQLRIEYIIEKEKLIRERKNRVEPKSKVLKIYHCQNNSCGGILGKKGVCLSCGFVSCKKCSIFTESNLPTKESGHECKVEDLETCKFLKSVGKDCPKCFTHIVKASGCDTMFCIVCKTFFDYKTGKIITKGFLHNPEYFDYLEKGGKKIESIINDEDNDCCNMEINMPSKLYTISDFTIRKRIKDSISYCNEFVSDNCTDKKIFLSLGFIDNAISCKKLQEKTRISYLKGEINESKYKQLLVKRLKRKMFYVEIKDLLNGFFAGIGQCVDFFLVQEMNIEQYEIRITNIVQEYNEIFTNVSKSFGIQSPYIVSPCEHYSLAILKNEAKLPKYKNLKDIELFENEKKSVEFIAKR